MLLQIVTGRGNRSFVRSRSSVREATLGLLQQLVPVRVAARNEGLLVVFSAHLKRLLVYVGARGRSFSVQDMQDYLVASAP